MYGFYKKRFNRKSIYLAVLLAVQAGVVLAEETAVDNAAINTEDMLPEVEVKAAGKDVDPAKKSKLYNEFGVLGTKSILDTPYSVTVVDSEEIVERGAKSIGQIFVNDASVYTPTSSSTTDWWGTQIRGLPVRNYYIDNIPLMLYWGGDFPVEVVESVTALKGLTGFMYGFGTPGGAISYTLKRPKATPETVASMGYRNPKLFSGRFDTSQNIGDDLAIRANFAVENGEAYNASKIERYVGSIAVDKKFGDSVNWFTTLVYEDNKTKEEPLQFYFNSYDVVGSNGKLPKVTYDYDDINVNKSYYESKTLMASTGLQWQLNDQWDVKYQTGFSRKKHKSNKSFANLLNVAGDYIGYAYNFIGVLDNIFHQGMLHGDVYFGGMQHEVVGGVGYQIDRNRYGSDFYYSNDFDGNIHQEQTFSMNRKPNFSLGALDYDARQKYGFISDAVHFNEKLQAIIGLRYTDYELKYSNYNIQETTPTLALIFKPNEQTSLYGSYIEGLEPGSQVAVIYENRGEVLDATVSKQYEIGVKHQSEALELSASVFRIERANEIESLKGGLLYYTQDGLTLYKGIELSSAYQFTNNLKLGLSAIHLDATIDKVSANNIALKGNTPANAADWQIVSNAEYKVPSIEGLKLHGNVRYYGESYTTDSNNLKLPDRTLVNAGFSYKLKMQDRDWTLYGNVYNLFNKKYWAGGGYSAGNVGEARNISMNLETKF